MPPDSRDAFSWYRNPLTTQHRPFYLGQGRGSARVDEGWREGALGTNHPTMVYLRPPVVDSRLAKLLHIE